MSRSVDASPPAKNHLAVMSRMGYDFNTAVADILDNSIAAKARAINIEFYLNGDSAIFWIEDDGIGMSENELIKNMSIGCKNADDERAEGDLGRFGAGLKTASFSQAGILSVVTKKVDDCLCAAVWDKAIVAEKGWQLEVLDPREIDALTSGIQSQMDHGTIVRWDAISVIQSLDHSPDKQIQIDDICSHLHLHIGLYFHKFLVGNDRVVVKINNRPVEPIDPFMRHIHGSEELEGTYFRTDKGDRIEIQGYRIPFIANMSKSDIDLYGGETNIRQNQGLYVYRQNRLIIAGKWMGLHRYSNLAGLTRIEVNVPSSLDNEWATDVKKSSLQIPPKVKEKIKRLLAKPIGASKRAYQYRGDVEVANPFWKANNNERTKLITYEIDPSNTDLQKIVAQLDTASKREFLKYLIQLSAALPLTHIYSTMATSSKSIAQGALGDDALKELIEALNNGF